MSNQLTKMITSSINLFHMQMYIQASQSFLILENMHFKDAKNDQTIPSKH